MKLRYTLILVGAVIMGGCSSPEIAEQKPQTDFTPHPAPLESVATVKSPVIMKGIYRRKSSWRERQYYSSEFAVMRSLRWLKKEQNKDGSWNSDKDPKALATGIAILPFLAHGETPTSPEFGDTVKNALKYLISIQEKEGRFKGTTKNPAIEHGIITWALCETYGLTKIPKFKVSAEKAISIILDSQLPSGLWSSDYSAEGVDDMEASVWQVRALKAARMSGLVDEKVRPALKKTVESLKKSIATATDNKKTAPAILSLQYIGFGRDPVCKKGIEGLEGMTMNWDNPEFDNPVYHWHFITQVKFHHGGQSWNEWNKSFAPKIPKAQKITKKTVKDYRGRDVDIGYWVSLGKKERYGRIYSTVLSCMMLQNYYAYLPTYKPPAIDDTKEVPAKDIVIEIDI